LGLSFIRVIDIKQTNRADYSYESNTYESNTYESNTYESNTYESSKQTFDPADRAVNSHDSSRMESTMTQSIGDGGTDGEKRPIEHRSQPNRPSVTRKVWLNLLESYGIYNKSMDQRLGDGGMKCSGENGREKTGERRRVGEDEKEWAQGNGCIIECRREYVQRNMGRSRADYEMDIT
jgi:hypothetical protein